MSDVPAIGMDTDKRVWIRTVRRALGQHGWQSRPWFQPGVDLVVRRVDAGFRQIVCLRDWREVTPGKLADIVEIRSIATVPVVCVFPRSVPDPVRVMLADRRVLVATIDALDTV